MAKLLLRVTNDGYCVKRSTDPVWSKSYLYMSSLYTQNDIFLRGTVATAIKSEAFRWADHGVSGYVAQIGTVFTINKDFGSVMFDNFVDLEI